MALPGEQTLTSPYTRPRTARGFFLLAAVVVLLIIGAVIYGVASLLPNVPSIDAVTDYQPKIPLRIYTADHVLIGEFGEEHRDFVPIAKVPALMKKAVLAIEDKRFYEHGGIDWIRAMGAVRSNLGGGFRQGGSTITMQVARNFFLSREKLIGRKLNEVALAYKIEGKLSKDEILELYMNQIYLGQRAYGFGSASQTYFGKPLASLSVAEMAMLAGLPQNPARHNPVANPKRARQRQQLVLKSMRELDYITEAQYRQAQDEPLRINQKGREFGTHAEYVAELARQVVYAQLKEEAYTRGIVVTTTIVKADQDAAYQSMRRNVLAYDQRHGYRGPEAVIDLPADPQQRNDAIDEALQKRRSSDGLLPAVVLAASPRLVRAETVDGATIEITGAGLKFAAAGLSAGAKNAVRIAPGAIVRVSQENQKWSIVQLPQVAAAFVSIDAGTGAYRALVGGFDFNLHKFNHVTQAWRQPGSAIKPFLFSSSLEKGFSPATRILDAPLDMPGEDAGRTWSPQNDDGLFDGPITMRYALAHSKNIASVRLLRAVTVPAMHAYLGKFGFDPARHPTNLTMALGTGAVTPLQMAGAYAVFANGGFQVKPYLISKIEDARGVPIDVFKAPLAGQEENRVLDARNAFVTDSMLRDVTRYGTGAAATQKLGRGDIAGKTGTTSDAVDGWFAGYGANVVAVAWMGFDEPKSLGGREFGATLAMPIWIDYMRVALAKRPELERRAPEGVLRQDDDWIYAEYADTTEFKSIDVPAAPPTPVEPQDAAAPQQQMPDN
ncbi:penicillin-binding protein [Massilia eurypsychrophila]|jgi:penicillin-binding protein 1A|uniref:Penicillin-binding protein 1A n=1 Tax=Massilia eurypsychrophila TaxID=1485217 RepID=A0A2G8TIW8_9BURK|nr:penicillin-binding protein [Massilia eurypsychrophila]